MKTPMKTKYFKSKSFSEDGKKQFSMFLNLPKNTIQKILGWYSSLNKVPRLDEYDFAKLADLTGESGENLQGALYVIEWFVDLFVEKEENPDDLQSDFIALELVKEAEIDNLELILKSIVEIAKKFKVYNKTYEVEGRGLQKLISSSMSAAIKPVFEKIYVFEEQSVQDYDPKILSYAVVAEIMLKRSNSSETFACQISRNNFNRFVSDLLALQTEMELMYDVVTKMSGDK